MPVRGGRAILHIAAGIISLGALTLSISTPASAQNIFERIFGGFRRAVEAPRPPSNVPAFTDPFTALGNAINPPQQRQLRAEVGPARAFCVRTCDGHFFPVQAHAGMTAADQCNSFCPATQTKLYSGGNIDTAAAPDGSRYEDLDNAFVYRKQMVAGCTCNGRDAFGLARVDVNTDPTLRPGDVVATKTGLAAFTSLKNKVAEFTPVQSYRGMPQSYRDKLSETKIMPPNPGAPELTTATISAATDKKHDDDRRRAQLSR